MNEIRTDGRQPNEIESLLFAARDYGPAAASN